MSDPKSVLERVGARITPREDAFERLQRYRRRRQRNQRITAGVVAVLVAVAGGVGVWAGFRGGTTVRPGGADEQAVALWPERTLAEIEAAQQRVDGGEDSWRLDAASTAIRFASDVLGWNDPMVSIQFVPGPVDAAVADVTTPPAPCPAPLEGEPISLTCLGKRAEVSLHGFTGPGGIWSVTAVRGDRTRIDLDPPFAVLPGQIVEAQVDVPEGAQAIGGGTFFGNGCQASFGSERLTESGKLDLVVPSGDCEVSDGYLYVYVVGSGPAWDPYPSDAEELLAEDPLAGRLLEPMDLTLIQAHIASDTSPQPVEQAEVPEVAEVVCELFKETKQQVRAQPNGVHLRVRNALDREILVLTGGDTFRVAASETVKLTMQTPPGTTNVVCTEQDRTKFAVVELTIVDPDGLWKSPDLECDSRDINRTDVVFDPDAGLVVVAADPTDAARAYLEPLLREGDEVESAGYPEVIPPLVRVVREGQTVATLEFVEVEHGGWTVARVSSCSEFGIA